MGKRARSSKAPRPDTTRAVVPAARHDFAGGLLGHDPAAYQINVSERIALAGDVAYACVRLISDTVSDGRVNEYRGDLQIAPSRLVRRPMATMTRRRWLWRMAATMALYNVAYYERRGRDSDGIPLSLVPIIPGQLVRVGSELRIGDRRVEDRDIGAVYRADFPTLDPEVASILILAREAIAATWSADAYRADYWENGGTPVVQITTDQPLTNTQADEIADRYATKRRDAPGKPAVFSRGASAGLLGADIGNDASSSSLEKLGAAVARYFGVPAWLVNVPTASGSMTYSNTESAGLDLVRYTLRGYLGPIEDALSEELPADYITGRRVAIDVSSLTLGTMLERAQTYQIATGGRPYMTVEEVRRELAMPPDAGLLDPAGAPAPALEAIP